MGEGSGFAWSTSLNGVIIAHASGRTAAMNKIDRPYQKGLGQVTSKDTGETWQRRGGAWTQTVLPTRKRGRSVAA